MLPVAEPEGRVTAQQIIFTHMLLPVSLLLTLLGSLAGSIFGAIVLGLFLAPVCGLHFEIKTGSATVAGFGDLPLLFGLCFQPVNCPTNFSYR
jgi:hypothetical protein